MIDLRLGRWQDVLADVDTCASVITDVPYSARVIKGQRSGGATKTDGWLPPVGGTIRDAAWTEADADEFCTHWLPRTRRFIAAFCDDTIAGWLKGHLIAAGWFSWHLVWIKPDGTPNLTGTGPDFTIEHLIVGRPRGAIVRRHRSGHYIHPANRGSSFVGAKPLGVMRAVVRDWSEPGDTVVDPFCGTGTTPVSCEVEGRNCIAAEVDVRTHAIAKTRIAHGYTPDMFACRGAP